MPNKATPSLAKLYQTLAESLSEPPDWLAESGRNWPLYQSALQLANELADPLLQRAVAELALIPSDGLKQWRVRYQALLRSNAQPLPIYESLAREGRLHGAATLRVWTLYQAAGLAVNGPELPDHASVELAFLAKLTQQELQASTEGHLWRKARREFIKQHAGQWLPALGHVIAHSSDLFYRPIGLLLSAVLQAEMLTPRKQSSTTKRRLPQLVSERTCTLCSFCVQVCPTGAMSVQENHAITSLMLNDTKCLACDRCVHICPTSALQSGESNPTQSLRRLYQSERAHCPGCGSPTVSQAELQAVAEQIGNPQWLNYCNNCRIIFLKESQ